MSAPESVPIPEELRGAIEQAQRLGAAIYLQDVAAAIGTDVARAHLRPQDSRSVAGYVTVFDAATDPPTDARFVFFFTATDPPELICRVRVPLWPSGEPTFEAFAPRVAAAPGAQLLIRARRTAIVALGASAQPQNIVILPANLVGEDGILVYLLAGSPRNDVAVFGKHHRVLISPDGTAVTRFEPLSRTAIEIPRQSPDMPAGSTLAGLWVTHLVTEWPLETHVFASLLYRTQVFVGTARGQWCVDGDKISFMGQGPPR